MRCADAESFTPAYVDGELAGVERDDYESHLHECPACARQARLQSRFKAAVRAHLPRPPVPPALRSRLEWALTSERPPAFRRWPWQTHPRLVPAAAAAAVLLATMFTVRGRSGAVEYSRTLFSTDLPMDVKGPDCASVTNWFQGKVGFPVKAPANLNGMPCKGGRILNVGPRGQPAAYIVYQMPSGHLVKMMVFDARHERIEAPEARPMAGGQRLFLDRGPGIRTAAYQEPGGLGYVATSDIDEDSLVRLVSTQGLH